VELQIYPALFTVAGAFAKGSGTYDLNTKKIDFRGKLAMSATLSQAAGGVKAVLIPLDPLFQKMVRVRSFR
jgi:hypothetical protein